MAESGNQNALKHGGERAVKQIQRGEPFTGAAGAAQLSVQADYQESGAAGMIRENAERLQAAARLYWECFLAAATARNLDLLDGYAARFGWLSGAALRAWAEVKKSEGKRGGAEVVLDAIKKQEANNK